jgi:serine/threonine protein kinase
MELCVFIQKNPKFFRENPKYFWIVVESILQALAYLYSQGIAHFDVKPENIIILFDTEGNILGAKLIDLGLSMEVNETTKCFRGTSAYMAPECFDKFLSTGFPADIWSFGMTLYAMLMASLPIYSKNKDPQRAQEEIYKKIEKLLEFKTIRTFSKRSDCKEIFQIEEFITSCFIVDPVERPTAQKLLDYILDIEGSNTQMSP